MRYKSDIGYSVSIGRQSNLAENFNLELLRHSSLFHVQKKTKIPLISN